LLDELLVVPALALGLAALADWLPLSVLLGVAACELGLGLALGFSVEAAPACVVAPCGGVEAELDGFGALGLLWFIWLD
jgi:hypothetical protein